MRDKTDALETLVSNLHVLALPHPALEWKKKKNPLQEMVILPPPLEIDPFSPFFIFSPTSKSH